MCGSSQQRAQILGDQQRVKLAGLHDRQVENAQKQRNVRGLHAADVELAQGILDVGKGPLIGATTYDHLREQGSSVGWSCSRHIAAAIDTCGPGGGA